MSTQQQRMGLVVMVGLVGWSGSVYADWPGFLGPNRNGISLETGLARQWGEGGPKVLWTLDVGPGFGGASISKDKVFLLDRVDDEFDVLRCVDLESGMALWHWSHEAPGRLAYNGSRGVPSVTDSSVVVMGPMGHIYAVDRKTHKVIWTVDLVKHYQASPPGSHGFPQSPLVFENLVVIAVMTQEAGIVAFDAATGQERWRTVAIGGGSHTSPMLTTLASLKGILFLNNSKVVFVDPENGKILWDYSEIESSSIPMPTVLDENHVFFTSGYDKGSVLLEVNRNGDTFSAKELFRFKEEGSMISTMVYHKEYLYGNFTRDENKKDAMGLVCLNREGKILWQTGTNPGFGLGNLILADGLIFILNGKSGELAMIEPNPQEYKELGRVKVLEAKGKNVWAPLAISGGRLIIRDQNQMKCLDVRKKTLVFKTGLGQSDFGNI